MASLADDIADLLEAQAIGTLGTDMFVGKEPAVDTLSILLLDVGGSAPNPLFARDFRDLQIVITGAVNGYSAAYNKAESIKNYLLGLDSQTVGTTVYFAFNMRSDITFVGYDNNDKPKFTLNFRIIVDSASVGNRLSL